MKKRAYLSTIVCSVLMISLACNFLTPTEVPTNVLLNNVQIPTEPTSPTLVNGLCKNKYLPIVNDSTKSYSVMTTIADSSVRTTNYETLFYFDDRDDFTVQTRLRKRVGQAVDEHWNCNKRGLVKTSFEGGEFSAYFIDDNDFNSWQTADTCREGVTLPSIINPGDTWTQETDFEFTSTNLTGWNWIRWWIFRQPVNSQTLPLAAGSGRFIYNYKAIGAEQVVVPAGRYNAIRIDVIAEGHIDPSRDFSPTFEYTKEGEECHRNSNKVNEVNPLMSLTFEGSTWWALGIGWVRKEGTLSNSQDVIEIYKMELESFDVP